ASSAPAIRFFNSLDCLHPVQQQERKEKSYEHHNRQPQIPYYEREKNDRRMGNSMFHPHRKTRSSSPGRQRQRRRVLLAVAENSGGEMRPFGKGHHNQYQLAERQKFGLRREG